MPTKLKKLKITELSLVDTPANPGAQVTLIKRAADTTPPVTVADLARGFVRAGASAEAAFWLAKRAYRRDGNGRFAGGSGGSGSGTKAPAAPRAPKAPAGPKPTPRGELKRRIGELLENEKDGLWRVRDEGLHASRAQQRQHISLQRDVVRSLRALRRAPGDAAARAGVRNAFRARNAFERAQGMA